MKIRMNSADLYKAITTVNRALPSRTGTVNDNILVETTDDGVRFTCTNGQWTIRTCTACEIEEEGAVLIPGKLATDVTRLLPAGDVNIAVSDQMEVTFRTQKGRTSMGGAYASDFPKIEEITEGATFILPQNKMKDMLGKVYFAIATDEIRQILTGGYMEISKECTTVVGLDGYRLAVMKAYGEYDIGEKETIHTIVPGRVISELSKMLEDTDKPVTFVLQQNHVKITMDNVEMFCQVLTGEYINYRQILPKDYTTALTVDRASLQRAIERAVIVSTNKLIRLRLEDGTVVVSANADAGNMTEEIPAAIDGKNLSIAFNGQYLLDVMRVISDDELHIHFNSNVSPCVFCPKEGDEYMYLVLPVRVAGQ